MLTSTNILDIMLHCVPNWSDIRKRTDKSTGGALLRAYANTFDDIQKSIDDYVKDFFIVSYFGKENDYIDYLMIGLVGNYETITLESPELEITTDLKTFYSDWNTYAYYQDGYILIHPDALGTLTNCIYTTTDSDGDIYKYSVKLVRKHIWNVFDEFALFAGITRYTNETNKQLVQRTLMAFQRFANSSEQGLKNAIKNAVHNYDTVTDEEIIIEKPNADNMILEDTTYGTVYERLSAFNRDIFRQKQWDKDLWFHEFKSLDYLPHKWDQEIPLTQNGVGSNDSLKVDYLQNIGEKDYTNVNVYGYKKSEKAIKEYIRNNNIETSITLQLDKYEDTIKAEEVAYKILANPVEQINPDTIRVIAQQQLSGEGEYDLADLVESVENVEIRRRGNELQTNKKYRLEFTPTEDFSTMNIYRCALLSNQGEEDLRKENSTYILQNKVLTNQNVLAHVTNTSGLLAYENLKNVRGGMTMDTLTTSAKAILDITGMSNKLLKVKVDCPEVDITSNARRVEAIGDFVLNDEETAYIDTSDSLVSAIVINMTCNSYSFEFSDAVAVTKVINGVSKTKTYESADVDFDTFSTPTTIQIYIRKNTANTVIVSNIKASAYNLKYTLDKKSVIINSMQTRLPVFEGKNTLTVEIEAGTQTPPTIQYIHIGPSLAGSVCAFEFNTNNKTDLSLDIDSTCHVSLYDITSGKTKIIQDGTTDENKSYTTKSFYYNPSNTPGYIFINTNDFIEIAGSDPVIETRYHGGEKSYITLAPGKKIESITINGNFLRTLESRSLSHYLEIEDSATKEVYVSTEPFFIVRDTTTNEDEQKEIFRSDLNPIADSFKVVNLPNTVNAVFQLTNGTSVLSSNIDGNFDSLYMQPKKTDVSVANNSAIILQAHTTGVELVNTFTPIIDLSTLYLYTIVPDMINEDILVYFPSGRLWSLGVPQEGLSIDSSLDYNNKSSYDLSISFLNGKYVLHNQMPLEARYSIGGEIQELAKFVITPQEGFSVGYENQTYQEEITVGNTRFTKLAYANIIPSSISIPVPSTEYSILSHGEEGIIVWKNDDHKNNTYTVSYMYKSPKYLYYADASILYNLIQYNISAYEPVGEPLIFYNIEDGNSVTLQFSEKPDIVITKCSNDSFETLVSDNTLSVFQIRQDNKIAIHNGWLYDDGLEYWRFTDKYIDMTDRFGNVILHNVVRFNGELLFNIKSTNYLPWSSMAGSALYKLADFDFTKRKFKNVSKFNSYTACNSYNGWFTYNFDITPNLNAYNNFGLEFKQQFNTDHSYAAIDITEYLTKNHIISLWTSGDLTVSLAKETQYDGMSFARSLCIEEKNLEKLSKKDAFWYKIVKENPEPEVRYFLYITGTNGVIDDLVELPYTNLNDMISAHKKNIDKLNLNINEEIQTETEYPLIFDYNYASYQDIDYNHADKILSTSTNVTYGLTKLTDLVLKDCKFVNARFVKNQIVTYENAKITTKSIYIKSPSLIYRFYVKVNDFQMDRLKGFTIRVYTNSANNSNYIKIFEGSNINIAEIPSGKVRSYVYVEIEAENGKVINNIEFYARYRENENIAALVPRESNRGEFISKLYDLGATGTFVWDSTDYQVIDGLDSAVKISLQGAKIDRNDFVFSDWEEYIDNEDDDFKTKFKDYRLFRYKVEIDNPETKVKINSINLKAVS